MSDLTRTMLPMTRQPKLYIVRRHLAPQILPESSATETLLLPTDNPWQWRHSPIQPELPRMRTKEDVIATMWSFPDCDVLPDTEAQRDALANAQAHFKLVARWLEYRLLGKFHYRDTLFSHPNALAVKPYADLSVATLRFCSQVDQRMPGGYDTFEQLWGMCEYSKALAVLRAMNYYGDMPPDWKKNLLANNRRALQAYSFKNGNHTEPMIEVLEPKEHICEFLLKRAIDFANGPPEDRNFKHHISQFKSSWRQYFNLMETKGFQPLQIEPTKSKKPRGRPRGSSRKTTA